MDIFQENATQFTSTRNESGARSIGHARLEMNGWQDEIDVKITFDARAITKKISHTSIYLGDCQLFFCIFIIP